MTSFYYSQDSFKGCRWSTARYLLRFLADLLQLLDNFVDAALEDAVQVRRDWFSYIVLSTFPWVGRELFKKKESDLDRMLGSLEGTSRGGVRSTTQL